MPITFACPCGRQLQMDDEFAGKRARCPECGAVVLVPTAEPPPLPPAPPRLARPVARPHADDVAADTDSLNPLEGRSRRNREGEEDEDDRPRTRRRRRDEDDDFDDEDDRRSRRRREWDEDDRPRRPRRSGDTAPRTPRGDREEPPRKAWNNRVAGGLTCMVIAVIWFCAGLAFDWVFYYPPILFVIGLVSLIRGLVTGRDE